LLGCALGLERSDERQADLSKSYLRAVRVDQSGELLDDYHTVQSPQLPVVQQMRARTRAQELEAKNPVGQSWTTITRREYIQDVRYTVVLWPAADDTPWSPEHLAQALRYPAHPLYAGRRSCPLSAPLAPEVLNATGLSDVLSDGPMYWDVAIPAGTLSPHHMVTANDRLLSPNRRAFGARQDYVL
jgi:CRISPR system Cascade subunit CasD